MSYETILYEASDGIARLTFNRSESLNSMSIELMQEINAAMTVAANDDAVRAVLMTGAGKGFCSGADLASTSMDPPRDDQGRIDLAVALREYYNPLVLQMRSMQKPIIAAVNGIAAGAGCSLALMADLTIAGRSAKFLQAFVNVALVPDAGATWILPRNTGSQRAMGMALLGDKITAEQAAAWGMIWQVVEDEALMETAEGIARKLANGPTQTIGRIKEAIYAAAGNDLSSQLAFEADLQQLCGQSEDFMEGATAFMEKRQAVFKGK